MLTLRKIAVTGGVASGKSSVCQFFKELGAFVVSADEVVHELLTPHTALGQQVIRTLGPEVLQSGKISRRIIAEKVFKDPPLLDNLEKLLHPAVLRKIEAFYTEAAKRGPYTAFAVESPLLFEIGNETFYDVVIVVLTDEAIAKERFKAAGFQPEEYDRRMSRQMNPHQKAIRAHYTLSNNGSIEELRAQAIAIYQIIQKN